MIEGTPMFRPIQEGWLAIANRTCVSFCNQPKAYYLATSRESRRYVVAGASIWLRPESLRHILASPGYAPGTIAINFTWMERGFNACKTTRCIYPSIFNRFPVIQAWSLKVRHFSTFCAHFGLPCGFDNRGKCYMDRKRIQCLSNASQHVPIYLQQLRYSELLVENCDIFTPHLCLAAPKEVTPLEFREDLDTHKTRMNWLSCGEEIMTICSAVLIQY